MHKWIILRFANDSFSGGYAIMPLLIKPRRQNVGRDPRSQRNSIKIMNKIPSFMKMG